MPADTIVLGQANLAYPMEHDGKLVPYAAGKCDVLAVCECRHRDERPLRLAPLLQPGWDDNQNTANGRTSATAVAWDSAAVHAAGRVPLRLANHRGRGVQERFISEEPVAVAGGLVHVLAGHVPLLRTGKRKEYVDSLVDRIVELEHHGIAWALGLDGNMSLRRLARQISRRVDKRLGRPSTTHARAFGPLASSGPRWQRDVTGWIVSRQVQVHDVDIDHTARTRRRGDPRGAVRHGWTDHALIFLTISIRR